MDVVPMKKCLCTHKKYSQSSSVYHFAHLQCGETRSKKLKEYAHAASLSPSFLLGHAVGAVGRRLLGKITRKEANREMARRAARWGGCRSGRRCRRPRSEGQSAGS